MNHIEREIYMLHLYESNAFYRRQLVREAEMERLSRLARAGRLPLSRAVLGWAGRRMMESGRQLMALAEQAQRDLPAVHAETYHN